MKRAIICAVVLAVSVGWWLTGAAVGQAMQAGDKDQQFVWTTPYDRRCAGRPL